MKGSKWRNWQRQGHRLERDWIVALRVSKDSGTGKAMFLKVEKAVISKKLDLGNEHSIANVKSWFSVIKLIHRRIEW